MNTPKSGNQRWRKILQTPISDLLCGRITGAQTPLERQDTASLPDSVVDAIRAITTRLSGRRRSKTAQQLVKSCKGLLLEGCAETQLVDQLSEPESIAALIQVTGKTDWILQTPLPARLWPTVHALVGQKRVRKTAARQMLSRVCRSLQWQLEAGRTPETLIQTNGDVISLGGLMYETQSLAPLLDFSLPESLGSVVLDVVKRTRLWRGEKLDTARELCAHFADGLEKGETEAALIKSFGSPKTAARLIRRACLRNRPFVWRAWRRTWQAAATMPAVVLVLWTILTMRFMVAQPTVNFDIIQEVDDLSRSIPKQDRAWPLYRQGLTKLTPKARENFYDIRKALDEGPASEHWPEAKTFLTKHSDALALFLAATSRPKLGFINRDPENSPWLQNQHHEASYVLNSPDPTKTNMSILLPQMQDLGFHVLPMLTGATHLAVEQGDKDRCLQLQLARFALLNHYSQAGPYPICQIGTNGLTGRIAQDIAKRVIESPEFFDDQQLEALFQKLLMTQIKQPDFRRADERLFIDDFLQKIYTDDGNGNGRFTPRGFQVLQNLVHFSPERQALFESIFVVPADPRKQETHVTETATFDVLSAPVAAMIADRKEMQNELLYLNELVWKARINLNADDLSAKTAYLTEYQRLMDSPHLRLKYLPALILMPDELPSDYWTHTGRYQVQRDAALVLIAAERYRRGHGQFPQTIEELVPKYLPDVPIDHYTGKPLQYSVKDGRPVIDSVGLKPDEN
ncbi:hypothetical protein [uncultured Gimesia sp.]|uniref:hypothetical protein n=1 Tax=uncultured Gimesia sp. TaxID=1678688 RepID=UPI0030DCEFF4|tara:strand:+ start:23623 stop:25851 length:2229 start_codon:yes stop_codon:yes gene_type:complete